MGLADRSAGEADDVVLGLPGLAHGFQIKSSQYPRSFGIRSLLTGANGYLLPLVESWKLLLREQTSARVSFVTQDIPSENDKEKFNGVGHSASFLQRFEQNPKCSLAEWRESEWATFIDYLLNKSGLTDKEFEEFFKSLRIVTGNSDSYRELIALTPAQKEQSNEIALLIPKLVTSKENKDRWTRVELLTKLSWQDPNQSLHLHQYPVEDFLQVNKVSEIELKFKLSEITNGYLSFLGAPGSGKSTLLQQAIKGKEGLNVIRYLAFYPGSNHGLGRAEATDFLDDVIAKLVRCGLTRTLYRATTLQEKRVMFQELLEAASNRYQQDGAKTVLIIDGLDHVQREEIPERSFLAELPLAAAIPEGVVFILGSQSLTLENLSPSIVEQACSVNRRIDIAPLTPEITDNLCDNLCLDDSIDRGQVFKIANGHPLATRYLIQALKDANVEHRKKLLAGHWGFSGDIETIYLAAWRGISADLECSEVLRYLALAEGVIEPQLLALAFSNESLEKAIKQMHHLLRQELRGYSIFHNSFRQFILTQPKMKFGLPVDNFKEEIYSKLAELSHEASMDSNQRWLELRYSALGGDHVKCLKLATPERFRTQSAEMRPFDELSRDHSLALISFQLSHKASNPNRVPKLFELMLVADEFNRREDVVNSSFTLIDSYLDVGYYDFAVNLSSLSGFSAYEVVERLIAVEKNKKARLMFDAIEPISAIGSDGTTDELVGGPEIQQWASLVPHFRDVEQILHAIKKVSCLVGPFASPKTDIEVKKISGMLKSLSALKYMDLFGEKNINNIVVLFKLDDFGLLQLQANILLAIPKNYDKDVSSKLLDSLLYNNRYLGLEPSKLRKISKVLVDSDRYVDAIRIWELLDLPYFSPDSQFLNEVEKITLINEIISHAELAELLSRSLEFSPQIDEFPHSQLQLHLHLLGKLRADAKSAKLTSNVLERFNREFQTFLRHTIGRDRHAFDRLLQTVSCMLMDSVLNLAISLDTVECENLVESWETFIESDCKTLYLHEALRMQLALFIYRCQNNQKRALRHLELLNDYSESTPEVEVERLGRLASAYVSIDCIEEGRKLLDTLHKHTLGITQAPNKDPQPSTWLGLMRRANMSDPQQRKRRVEILERMLMGMAKTEGSYAAECMSSGLVAEATKVSSSMGLHSAKRLNENNLISWARIIDGLLMGLVYRRADLVQPLVVIWCELCLPHYVEPYHSSFPKGDFIEAALTLAAIEYKEWVASEFLVAITTYSSTSERGALLNRLRDVSSEEAVGQGDIDLACKRWLSEAPLAKSSKSNLPYTEISSLDLLEKQFETELDSDNSLYGFLRAFERLAIDADFHAAKAMFDKHDVVHSDVNCRLAMIERAINLNELEYARQLESGIAQTEREISKWSHWGGGTALKYFRLKSKIYPEGAKNEAFDALVQGLVDRKLSAQHALFDIEGILDVIGSDADSVAIWDILERRLKVTREWHLGKSVAESPDDLEDEQVLIELIVWALSLPLPELRWRAESTILKLNSIDAGLPIFHLLLERFLNGAEELETVGLRLALSVRGLSTTAELSDLIRGLVNHPNYAVATMSVELARKTEIDVIQKIKALPAFYKLELPSSMGSSSKKLIDSKSQAMLVEDELGWTDADERVIRLLENSGVSAAHIRIRCRQLINSWGGLKRYGQSATRELESNLNKMKLRINYLRPHREIAIKALSHVAGELKQGGVFLDAPEIIEALLYDFGSSLTYPPRIKTVQRPNFISTLRELPPSWGDGLDVWLLEAEQDLLIPDPDEAYILVEVYESHMSDGFDEFTIRRVVAPNLPDAEVCPRNVGSNLLESAIWIGAVQSLSSEPSLTIARSCIISGLPTVPSHMLVICPYWLRSLGWRICDDSPLTYIDGGDTIVAQCIWWRDSGPIDYGENSLWSEGWLLSLTKVGKEQLEAKTGPLVRGIRTSRQYRRAADEPRIHHAYIAG